MADPTFLLHKVIYDSLSSHFESRVRIYDIPPVEAALPYITIGDFTSVSDQDKTVDGLSIDLSIHIWSNYTGRKEIRELSGEVREAVLYGTLLMPDYNLWSVRHESTQDFLQPDGVTTHAIVRFIAMIEFI